jgi:hypothetical protein
MDQLPIGIERAEHSSLIQAHTGLHELQSILGYEKHSLHRAVVPPKPYRTARSVVKAALVRKTQAHQDILLEGKPGMDDSYILSDTDQPVQSEDIMAFKPNYGRDRAERQRAARARSEEKQRKKDEKTAQRKAERDAPAAPPDDNKDQEPP